MVADREKLSASTWERFSAAQIAWALWQEHGFDPNTAFVCAWCGVHGHRWPKTYVGIPRMRPRLTRGNTLN